MTEPDEIILDNLAHLPVWVGWREVQRNGKGTKVPYNPRTGEEAKSTDPTTWATRGEAESWAILSDRGGVGIVLGGDCRLGGIDLDSCRNPTTETIEVWAQQVISRFATYTEISPSRTGVKLFFRYASSDTPAIEKLFDGKGGRQFKNGGGGEHPPAIEIYHTGRYFTTTDESVGPTDILRQVPLADLEWIIRDAGPAFAHKESKKSESSGNDQSRSGKAFRKGATLKAAGYSYYAMRDALLADEDPEIVEWARTKGLANGERELHRIYYNAKTAPDFISPDSPKIALHYASPTATGKISDTLQNGANGSPAGTYWDIEKTLLAPHRAREICRTAAAECNKPSESKAIVKWRTVSAVETMARSDRRTAATGEQWDSDLFY